MISQAIFLFNQFFFEPESPKTLAIFRIIFGFLVLFSGLLLLPDLMTWYGPTGLTPLSVIREQNSLSIFRLNFFLWIPQTKLCIQSIYFVFLLGATTLSLGLLTRTSSLIVFIGLSSLQNRNPLIMHSGDVLMRLLSFLIIFSEAGKTLSLDRWIRLHFKSEITPPSLGAPWAHRLIQIQITLVYLFTSLSKLENPDWRNGTALYYILRLDDFRKFPLPQFLDHPAMIRAMTWGTLTLELALGTLIWIPAFRYPILAAGIIFHCGIEYSMNIPVFELLMIASLLNFVHPKDWPKSW